MSSILSRHIKRGLTYFTLLTLTTYPAYTSAALPGSGSILDSVKPPATQQPVVPAPQITIRDQASTPTPDDAPIGVKAFYIDGQSPVPAAELLALIQSEAGKDLTLSQLNALANKLTHYLRSKGYLVAFAYLPAQTVEDGVVRIAVLSGQYGELKITGHSHVDFARIKDMLFCAKPGSVITKDPLDRALLLVSDLSGLRVKATLSPGVAAGTADLILEIIDTDSISGTIYSDNWGSHYTGGTRYGAQISLNNPSGTGDLLSAGALTTFNGIDNYNLSYNLPIGVDGARLNLSYSNVDYTLGGVFSTLNATGQAAVTSYQLSYPFHRSRTASLYGSIGYDHKELRDDITNYSSYNPRSSNLWHIGLSSNFADSWLGGGTNAVSLTSYRGQLALTDTDSLANDATTAQTDGHFTKTVLTWQRQQAVAQNLNLILNFTGQFAGKNLDSSEKLNFGGADGVRAYPQGEGSGDQGSKFTGELRWRLPGVSTENNSLYLNTFYDYGQMTINKTPYTTDDNHRSLAAIGLGLLWVRGNDFTVRLDYAWKVGHEKATADTDKNGRCWLQAVNFF